jgi:predicted Zn-dependent peptidase
MPLNLPIHERTLDNGLRVVVSPDHALPAVAVCIWYDVGSRHEDLHLTGLAHLFEHLMFQGSANVHGNGHFETVLAAGGTLNGTTSFDRTNYFETMPSHHLETALWLEADRMGTLLAALTQENLDNQRAVVKNERRQRYDNQPYGTASEHLYSMLMPQDHPYQHLPIGSMEHLDAASLEDCEAFFRRHYAPNNAVLSLVGDVDPDEGFSLVQKYFSMICPVAQLSGARDGTVGPLAAPVELLLREQVPAERVTWAWRVPTSGTEEVEAVDLVATVLGQGDAAVLEQRLVRELELAQGVGFGVNPLVGGVSVATLSVTLRPGATLAEVRDVVEEEIRRIAVHGPTPQQLERARALTERAWADHLTGLDGRADELCRQALQHGSATHLLGVVDRALAVSPQQCRDAAGTWLRPEARAQLAYEVAA